MSAASSPEDEESEGYFASISDLMVGVLFVFLLMLTVLASNYRDGSEELAAVIARMERAEAEATRARTEAEVERAEAERQTERALRREEEAVLARAEAETLRRNNQALRTLLAEAAERLRQELAGREAARALLLQRLAQGLQERGIPFVLDQRSGVLRLSDAVPFDPGQSEMTATARRTTTALGEVLVEVLPCFSRSAGGGRCLATDAPVLEAMLVEGHTDRTPYVGMSAALSQQQNDRLSAARALTVFAELRRQQPALDGLRNPADLPLLGVSGYGERRPLPETGTMLEGHLAQNRRIDLRFILSANTSDEIRRLLESITSLNAERTP